MAIRCLGLLLLAVFCAAEDLSSDVNTPVVVTENDIIRDLMRRDVKWGPPSTGDKPTMVSVSLKLTAVTEVNRRQGHITTTAFLYTGWRDTRLMFDTSPPFNTVQYVSIPVDGIWRHNIELFNPAEDGVKLVNMQELAIVQYNGSVLWVPAVRITSLCDDLLTGNDQVNCLIQFGSWTQDTKKVDVFSPQTTSEDILVNYSPLGRWVVTAASAQRDVLQYSQQVYSFMTFNLTLQRTQGSGGGD